MTAAQASEPAQPSTVDVTCYGILVALGVSHLLNDLVQSLIPAIYPMLKESLRLSYSQIGLITLVFQITASLLQPAVGLYTDRSPKPYSLVVGMAFTLVGLIALSLSASFAQILISAMLVGLGSAIFHPESSRMARAASGGRHGLAQSIFQVGGNAGTALGPLLAAFIIVPRGQASVAWFSVAAIVGAILLFRVGRWYVGYLAHHQRTRHVSQQHARGGLSNWQIGLSLTILICLMFSKYIYQVSLSSYYTFYLIDKFQVSTQVSQLYLFVFLGAFATGTVAGGAVGDRFGYKIVIWGSILGVVPFTLLLPYANLFWTCVLTVPIGLILASAFSSMLVYAHQILPGRVGMVSGLFFGLAFGFAGIGAAALGELADRTSITFVYHVCSFLPLVGFLAAFLPRTEHLR